MAAVSITAEPIVVTASILAGLPAGIVAAPITDYSHIGATITPYVYVVDSGNDRVNAYDYDGLFQFSFGSFGTGDGEFDNPYGITSDGSYLYVTDSGNNRVQIFTMLGVYVDQFGSSGTADGELSAPKGISISDTHIYVVDSGNNRFQLFDITTYAWVYSRGSYGTGVDEFDAPTDSSIDPSYYYITDSGNDRTIVYSIPFTIPVVDDTVNVTITADLELPGMTVYAESLSNVLVTVNATLPGFTVEAYTAGIMVSEIGALTSSGTMLADLTLSALASLPGLTISGEITAVGIATFSAELPGLQILASGSAGSVGIATLELPGLTALIRGFGGQLSEMSAELPALESSGAILVDVTATGLLILPALEMVAYGHYSASAGTFEILAFNTVKKAVTNYVTYPFNSMTYFNGQLLMAGSSGLFRETGDLDVAAEIDAHIRTNRMDFFAGYGDTPNIMRKVREGLLLGRTDGNLLLTITVDEDRTYSHDINEINDYIHDTRVKFARGMKGRNFDFKIENVDGCDFEIVNFRVKAESFPGRRR